MKNKNKKTTNKIDAQLVEAWMGSNATISDYAEIIATLANEDYLPSQCRTEVQIARTLTNNQKYFLLFSEPRA